VRGKVNVVSNQDINDEKLYQFFTSILQVHGDCQPQTSMCAY
jgi:hypothetical protein